MILPTAKSTWRTPDAMAAAAVVLAEAHPKLAARAKERLSAIDDDAVSEMSGLLQPE